MLACMDIFVYVCARACMHAHTHIHMPTQKTDMHIQQACSPTHSLTHEFVHTGDRSILDPQLEPTSAVPVGVPSEASPAVPQAVSPAPMQADFSPRAKNKNHDEDKQVYDKHRPFFGLRDIWKGSPQVETRETRWC